MSANDDTVTVRRAALDYILDQVDEDALVEVGAFYELRDAVAIANETAASTFATRTAAARAWNDELDALAAPAPTDRPKPPRVRCDACGEESNVVALDTFDHDCPGPWRPIDAEREAYPPGSITYCCHKHPDKCVCPPPPIPPS